MRTGGKACHASTKLDKIGVRKQILFVRGKKCEEDFENRKKFPDTARDFFKDDKVCDD